MSDGTTRQAYRAADPVIDSGWVAAIEVLDLLDCLGYPNPAQLCELAVASSPAALLQHPHDPPADPGLAVGELSCDEETGEMQLVLYVRLVSRQEHDDPWYARLLGAVLNGYTVIAVIPHAADSVVFTARDPDGGHVVAWMYRPAYSGGQLPSGWSHGRKFSGPDRERNWEQARDAMISEALAS